MFQISFIRTEGVQVPCEVLIKFHDKRLAGHFEETCFSIPKGVLIRIKLIKPTDQSSICTVSLNTDLLPYNSFQWLPLSYNPKDLYKQLPEEVEGPKVLVYVAYELSPVKEASESESEEFSLKIQSNPVDLQQILDKTVKDLQYFKDKYEEEVVESNKLKQKLKKIMQEYEEAKSNAKLREEFLESLINDKIKAPSQNILTETKKLNCLGEDNKENVEAKNLGHASKEKSKSVNSKKKINNDRFDVGNQTMTHLALQNYMKKKKNLGMFVRDTGNLYQFGNKKIFITLKNGVLLCRVGSGFEDLDKFVRKFSALNENQHKRSHTISTPRLLRQ